MLGMILSMFSRIAEALSKPPILSSNVAHCKWRFGFLGWWTVHALLYTSRIFTALSPFNDSKYRTNCGCVNVEMCYSWIADWLQKNIKNGGNLLSSRIRRIAHRQLNIFRKEWQFESDPSVQFRNPNTLSSFSTGISPEVSRGSRVSLSMEFNEKNWIKTYVTKMLYALFSIKEVIK